MKTSPTDTILRLSIIGERKLARLGRTLSADELQERTKELVFWFLSSPLSPDYIRELSLDYDGITTRSISHKDKRIKNAARAGLALISEKARERKMETLQKDHNALEYLAGYDVLTSLPNRKKLSAEINKQIDGNTDAVFMIFDLRNFKYINDTFGHTMGDDALELFANVSREFCWEHTGIIARTGGDEFIGMFQGYSLEEWREMAHAFRLLLESKFQTSKMLGKNEAKSIYDIPFTAAIGVTSLYNTDGEWIHINYKDKDAVRTELDHLVSLALRRADLMAHAAKGAKDGIIADWDDAYLKVATLNPENEELQNQFGQILRHWTSDESVPENIKKIRELILPSLDFLNTLDEIDALWWNMNKLLEKSNIKISPQLSRDLKEELVWLRKRWWAEKA